MPEALKYVLLDANLLAGYYAPQTLNCSGVATVRIAAIIDAVRVGTRPEVKRLAPSICVAEAFTVLSKCANVRWEGRAKRSIKRTIHARTYKKLHDRLAGDVHHARLIERVEPTTSWRGTFSPPWITT
jgi:hypothetical protein